MHPLVYGKAQPARQHSSDEEFVILQQFRGAQVQEGGFSETRRFGLQCLEALGRHQSSGFHEHTTGSDCLTG